MDRAAYIVAAGDIKGEKERVQVFNLHWKKKVCLGMKG